MQQRHKYDPFSNAYNVGWRDHPNFSYLGNQQSVPNANFSHPPVSINQECSNLINLGLNTSQNKGTSLEDLVKSLATSSLQFQQEARTTIKNLETQVSQLPSTVGKLEAQGSGKLPSQTIVNAREMWLHLFQELNFLAVPWLIFLFFVLLQVVFHSSTSQN